MKQLVTIIVSCYNQSQYLSEALQSVLEQTYTHWECIIVNDGSTDNTATVAKQWISKDNRFKYIQKINGGLSSARNAGLDQASGEFIQFLDADDYLHKLKLEESLAQLFVKQYDLIVTNYESFTTNSEHTKPPFYYLREEYFTFESVLFRWDTEFAIPIHCALFKKHFFQNFKFPHHLKAKEDWIMWIVIFKQNPICVFINKPYALYRVHSNSMTVNQELMQTNQVKAYLFLKNIVDEDDYDKLITAVMSQLYTDVAIAQGNLMKIKKSKTYQVGAAVRDTFHKIKNIFTVKPRFFEQS